MTESKTYTIETSLSTAYRRQRWGLERIVLDGISNHLPADSKGTNVAVRFKQAGEYVDLQAYDPAKETEEVVFEDDGQGYDAKLLSVLFSTKDADALSVGQFGEGLKLIAAAALRDGIEMEYRSQNWVARPYANRETIAGTQLDRLCFGITENGYDVKGSQTVFRTPSQKFITEVLMLPEKVLPLGEEVDHTPTLPRQYRVFYVQAESNAYPSQIIEKMPDKSGHQHLFVKGVRLAWSSSLFSYDLGLEDITPDRIYADSEKILDRIGTLLKGCTNEDVIERVLLYAHAKPHQSCDEFAAFNSSRNAPKGRGVGQIQPGIFFKDHYINQKISTDDIVDLNLKETYKFFREEDFKYIFDTFGRTLDLSAVRNGQRWATVFHRMFGEKAVIASDNANDNEDATLQGYIPIAMNQDIASYLAQHGIEKAEKHAKGTTQEYRWLDDSTLTDAERGTLEELAGIAQQLPLECALPAVHVYEGLFTNRGEEIGSTRGVTLFQEGVPQYVGLKRSLLQEGLEKALPFYLHELGHFTTRAKDHSRQHAQEGYDWAAALALRLYRGSKEES